MTVLPKHHTPKNRNMSICFHHHTTRYLITDIIIVYKRHKTYKVPAMSSITNFVEVWKNASLIYTIKMCVLILIKFVPLVLKFVTHNIWFCEKCAHGNYSLSTLSKEQNLNYLTASTLQYIDRKWSLQVNNCTNHKIRISWYR